MSGQELGIILGLLGVMLVCSGFFGYRASYQRDEMRRKIYNLENNCRECGYPERLYQRNDAELRKSLARQWDKHHPNCPIGRLGL